MSITLDGTAWRPAPPRPVSVPRAAAIAIALMFHAVALIFLMSGQARRLPAPRDLRMVSLFLAPPERQEPAPVAAPVAAQAPAPPSRQPPAIAPATPPHMAITTPRPRSRPVFHPAPRVQATAEPAAPTPITPAVTAQQPAPPPPQADHTSELASLNGQVKAAVQQAAVMPPAARRMGREGRAQIGFTYSDGTVDNVALLISSQSRLLDDAALQAVRTAHYPLPPPPLRGAHLQMQVWVDFELQDISPS